MTSDETRDETAPPDPATPARELASRIAALDRELAEIGMLSDQVRSEAARFEGRRAQAAERMGAAIANPALPALKDVADSFNQLVTLTKRATLMESQAELLDAKAKALARHRASLLSFGELALGVSVGDDGVVIEAPGAAADGEAGETASDREAGALPDGTLSPALWRMILAAQEDLRREIARSMHDGPAQSLTNIILQTQILDRLLDRDPAAARDELRQLAQMVQQTLDTTKGFIFDVRPMVLDDLGLVPTLRRAARERGQRARVPVALESHGRERRLPMELESTLFRILDEALSAYLAQGPDRVSVTLEWGPAELTATVASAKSPDRSGADAAPPAPEGEMPDAMRRMIEERRAAAAAAASAAEAAAQLPLPAATQRGIAERAAAVGATVDLSGAGSVRVTVPLPEGGGGALP